MTRRRRQPSGLKAAAAALVVLTQFVGACASVASSTVSTSVTTPPVTTSTSATTTATTTSPVAAAPVELTTGLPRSVDYVWLETTVIAATLAAVEPRTFLTTPEPSVTPYLFLTLETANRSERDGLIITPLPYSLSIGDQRFPASQVLEGRPHVGFSPLGTEDKVVAFEVPPGTSFESIALVVEHDGRIPAILPLVGEVPEPGFPVDVAVGGTGPAQGGVSGCNQALDITMLGGSIDIDLPVSDAPPTGYGSRRAAEGDRFLSLDVRVHNNGGARCGAGATNYDPRLFRLIVDGVPRAPATFLSGIIAADTAADLTVHFVVPADADEVEFTVGSEDGTQFVAPVDITAGPSA